MTTADEQLANFRNEQLEKEIRGALEQREKTKYRQYVESHPDFVKEVDDARLEAGKSLRYSFKQAALALADEEKRTIDEKIVKLEYNTDAWDFTALSENELESIQSFIDDIKKTDARNKNEIVNLQRKRGKIDEDLKDLDGEIEKIVAGNTLFEKLVNANSIKKLYTSIGRQYNSSYSETLEVAKTAVSSAPPELADAVKKSLELAKNSEGYMKLNDIFVNRLVEIAKEKGTEHALSDETIYSAKKWVFPTPEAYQKHLEAGKKMTEVGMSLIGETFQEQLKYGMTASGEDDAQLLETLGKIIGITTGYKIRFVNKIDDELAKPEMDKIYAKPSVSPLETERARILNKYAEANKGA